MVSPILIIAVSLFMAFSVPIWGMLFGKKVEKFVPLVTFAINLYIAIVNIPIALQHPIVVITAGFKPPFGINLTVGPLGIFLATLIQFMGLLVAIYVLSYKVPEPSEKFYMLLILAVMGASGIVMTGDIFNLFVFLEITSIASYSLAASAKTGGSVEGAFKYIVLGSLGSTLVLLGIALLYAQLGTLNMADIARQIGKVDTTVLVAASLLFITGFAVEAEAFPMNGWVPDAYTGAPFPAVAIFAGAIAKAGIYGIARIFYTIIGAPSYWHLIMIIGILTLLIGELSALLQKDFKRLLAYSSIGQMGLVLVAIGAGTLDTIAGGLFQAFNHAITKGLLFLTLGIVVAGVGSSNLQDLEGLGKKKPYLGLLFFIGILSLIGMPPFAGFWSKILVVFSIIKANYIVYAVLILVGAAIEVAYYVRVLRTLYSGSYKGPEFSTSFLTGLTVTVLALVIIVVGFYPKLVTHFVYPAAKELLGRGTYIQAVLGGKF